MIKFIKYKITKQQKAKILLKNQIKKIKSKKYDKNSQLKKYMNAIQFD